MLRRIMALSMTVVFSAMLLGGCASQTTQEHKGAMVGGGAGAVAGGAAGGAIGAQSGHTAAGIVIGALVGGLAGAAVGHYFYDKRQNEEEAQKKYAYDHSQAQANLVRVESARATPSEVYPGGTVELVASYTVLGEHNATMDVTEIREVRRGGALEGRPQVTVKREGGTYESRIPLVLSSTAAKGAYVVITTVQAGSSSDSRESYFSVR